MYLAIDLLMYKELPFQGKLLYAMVFKLFYLHLRVQFSWCLVICRKNNFRSRGHRLNEIQVLFFFFSCILYTYEAMPQESHKMVKPFRILR